VGEVDDIIVAPNKSISYAIVSVEGASASTTCPSPSSSSKHHCSSVTVGGPHCEFRVRVPLGERSYHSSSGSSRNTLRTPSLQSALSAVKYASPSLKRRRLRISRLSRS